MPPFTGLKGMRRELVELIHVGPLRFIIHCLTHAIYCPDQLNWPKISEKRREWCANAYAKLQQIM
jgi:hypothetical protein